MAVPICDERVTCRAVCHEGSLIGSQAGARYCSQSEAKVLIVEDDPTILDFVREALTEEGYATAEATDGLAALAMLEAGPYDLIIVDLFMPRMDGVELLNVTRLNRHARGTPFIVITASDRLPADERIRAVLKKPFDVALLLAAVASVIQRARLEDTAASS